MIKQELRSCPFCGGDALRVIKTEYNEGFITCRQCGANSGFSNNNPEKKWNTRAFIPLNKLRTSFNAKEFDDYAVKKQLDDKQGEE